MLSDLFRGSSLITLRLMPCVACRIFVDLNLTSLKNLSKPLISIENVCFVDISSVPFKRSCYSCYPNV